jgi:DNA-directed RNA polymerase subunit F
MSEKLDPADVPAERVEQALLNAVPIRKFQSESLEDYTLDWKSHPTIDLDKYPATIAGKEVVGWGKQMSDYLGGVHQGSLIGISANGAGMGKTSYLQQMTDAIALRNSWVVEFEDHSEPLMPLLYLSELDKYELKLRTLGRYMQVPYSALRSKRRAMHLLKLSTEEADAFKDKAEAFAKEEKLGERIRPWIHSLDPKDRTQIREILENDLYLLKTATEAQYPEWKDKVWPVVALDPLQRWVASESDTIMGAGSLAIWVRSMCRRNGYIGFFTSDTNKASAAANKEGLTLDQAQAQTGVEAFRGSQEIMHAATAAIVLYRLKSDTGNPHDANRTMYASVVKNRDGLDRVGVSYSWHRPTGTFSEIGLRTLLDWKDQQRNTPKDVMKVIHNLIHPDDPHEVVDFDQILAAVDPKKLEEAQKARQLNIPDTKKD